MENQKPTTDAETAKLVARLERICKTVSDDLLVATDPKSTDYFNKRQGVQIYLIEGESLHLLFNHDRDFFETADDKALYRKIRLFARQLRHGIYFK